MTQTKPNFFIVGAPKSGTTSLAVYLGEHPEVFMLKGWDEPHFFGGDLPKEYRFKGDEQEYLALFEGAKGCKRIGEKSTWYLYSKQAAWEIKEYAPESKIIIMLRNPVDMMQSLHAHNLYKGYEDIDNFEEALAAQADREAGRRIPEFIPMVDHLFYTRVPRYTEQVQRFFKVFGRDNVFPVIFEEFKRDTPGIYYQTVKFLDLDPGFTPAFKVWNPRRHARSQSLRDFYRNPPQLLRSKVGRVVLPPTAQRFIIKFLKKINTEHKPPPPISKALRQELIGEFYEEIKRLSRLTGCDFSQWTSV